MELLEADFAQIEHVNQIIYDNMTHDKWACFDSKDITDEYPSLGIKNSSGNIIGLDKCKDIRYDFLLLTKTYNWVWKDDTKEHTEDNKDQEKSSCTWTFTVRNALWDGTYRIYKSGTTSPLTNPATIQSPDENTLEITVFGTERNSLKVCFHMSMAGDGRTIDVSSIYLDTEKEYEHQYDESVTEEGYVYTENDQPVINASVSITPCNSKGQKISAGIPRATVTTDSKGKFKMPYGAVDTPGEYYVLMEAYYFGVTTNLIVHVSKVQQLQRAIDWGDASNYNNIYKGSIHTYKIHVTVLNKFGIHDTSLDKKIEGQSIDISFINAQRSVVNTQTCTVTEDDGQYYILPEISYRKYYEDTSTIKVQMVARDGFPAYTSEHLVNHAWYVAEKTSDIHTEINDVNGSDWIFLKPQTYKLDTTNNTIKITRPQTIAGLTGTQNCIIDGIQKYNAITIQSPNPARDNYMQVQLLGISFQNCQCAVKQATGSQLLIDSCYFTHNYNSNCHHKGCSILQPATDNNIANRKLFYLTIRNSTFYNNKGNEIQSIGETEINSNLFRTDNSDYLQQPEVKIVSVRSGNTIYKYNKSHIKILDKEMNSNHSFAKALTFVDWGGTFNKQGPRDLYGHNTLHVFGKPWYNMAYTYAIYYYPYGYNRKLVCCPRSGHERRATGHGGALRRYIYWDGYHFPYRSTGLGNTKDPWTKQEIAIPSNTGIYNTDTDKFEPNYDPRLSNSNSVQESIPYEVEQ